MQIETWPIERLIPYEKNARIIPQAAIDKVAASLKEFGWQQPIVVDKDGVMIVGHVRRLGALQLGWTECPVHVARDLTAKQVKQYRLMDNRSHEEATWDEALLRFELGELEPLDLGLTGFDLPEIDELLGGNAVGLTDEDDVPEVPEHPVSRLGDLWILGKHRLLCGSCLEPANIARLLSDPLPRLLVTDPPYGIQLDMEWRDRAGHNEMGPASRSYMKIAMDGKGISGDTEADWSKAFELVPSLNIAYVWHATSHLIEVAQGLMRIGFQLRQQIIWQKTVAAMSRSAYHWKHEPCWYAVRKGKTATWQGSKDQTTLWEAASPKHIMSGSKEEKLPHPTQKPAELMRRPIANHLLFGECVYDPFLGSGTTLIAAEKENMVCYGCEIEPRFADVIVKRWQDFTGKTAHLEDGQTFERVSEIRRCEREAERCRTEPGTTPSEQRGAMQGEVDWTVAKQMAEEKAV